MSISARGEIEGEGAGLETWLPRPEPATFASAAGIATLVLIRKISASVPIINEWVKYTHSKPEQR